MKFKTLKRLSLNKETVAALNDSALNLLRGGIRQETFETCEHTCENTCWSCGCPTGLDCPKPKTFFC